MAFSFLFWMELLMVVASSEVDVERVAPGTAMGSPGSDTRMGIRDV